MEQQLKLTTGALARVTELISDEGDPKLKFRVFIEPGGCSGFEYGFGFEEAIETDYVMPQDDVVSVIVDKEHFELLKNATVDYVQDLQGSRFMVINPNAKNTCGCGTSFCVE